MKNEVISLRKSLHLGDAIALLICLYNRYLLTGCNIEIYSGPAIVGELLAIFDFQGLHFIDDKSSQFTTRNLRSFLKMEKSRSLLPFLDNSCCSFIRRTIEMIPLDRIELPKPKFAATPEDLTLFQFDTRSPIEDLGKYSLSDKEMRLMLQFFGSGKMAGVGGPETTPYLDADFHLGNLSFIAQKLLACKSFIGIDSGISHVAGTLGKTGDIVVVHTEKHRFLDVVNFYKLVYPTLRMHRKSNLFSARLL